MRTAIVSDLHLGGAFGEDIARDAAVRQVLLEEIAMADRVVLLGDVLELRELPLPAVLETAQPFFEELGRALRGREILLVPGNHDHRLAEPLLEELAIAEQPLGLEHRVPATGEVAGRITDWLGDVELTIAYPGVWLREDVYATHGHYMDCHMSLPRLECIAAAAVMRNGNAPPDPATPIDYERVLRPVYGLSYALAQSGHAVQASRPSERAWRSITGRGNAGGARRTAIRTLAKGAVPATIWTINRLLRAEFEATLSPVAITRSGIDGATEMARRLGVDGVHVIVGHTHRAGPDEGEEWPLPGGGSLHNTGSWVFADAFHHPGAPPGPYWPGTVTWIEDEAPPRRVRLLVERPHAEMRATVSRSLQATRR